MTKQCTWPSGEHKFVSGRCERCGEYAPQKWFARRNAVAARTDEDAAMAAKSAGPYATRSLALAGLENMIMNEITGWQQMNMDASRDERALARVQSGEDNVVEDGVRWNVIEVTGNPPAHVTKWQCDVHAITIASAACCENGTELGSYLLDERVCCAVCEERSAEPDAQGGREFGRRSSNGPVCMPCVVAVDFRTIRLTETQINYATWVMNPSKDTARKARRATARTRANLIAMGIIVDSNTHPYYAITIMGRKWIMTHVNQIPLIPYATQAAHLVATALASGHGATQAEAVVAEELADAIERSDRPAQAYHRATLDVIAQIKNIVLASGGSWK